MAADRAHLSTSAALGPVQELLASGDPHDAFATSMRSSTDPDARRSLLGLMCSLDAARSHKPASLTIESSHAEQGGTIDVALPCLKSSADTAPRPAPTAASPSERPPLKKAAPPQGATTTKSPPSLVEACALLGLPAEGCGAAQAVLSRAQAATEAARASVSGAKEAVGRAGKEASTAAGGVEGATAAPCAPSPARTPTRTPMRDGGTKSPGAGPPSHHTQARRKRPPPAADEAGGSSRSGPLFKMRR